jgi:hypothetical protein
MKTSLVPLTAVVILVIAFGDGEADAVLYPVNPAAVTPAQR